MTIAETFISEFDQEMAITRRVLERVPAEKGPWKPHEKSFPIGHLAQLLARMPSWITNVVQETALDLSQGGQYTSRRRRRCSICSTGTCATRARRSHRRKIRIST